MAYEVGTAFVQIAPSFQGILEKIDAAASEWGDEGGKAFRRTFQAALGNLAAKIGLDDSAAKAQLADLNAELEATGERSPEAKVGVDDAEAVAALGAVDADLIGIGAMSPTAKVYVDVGDGLAEIGALEGGLLAIGESHPTVKIDVDGGEAITEIAGVEAAAGGAGDSVRTLGNDASNAGRSMGSLTTAALALAPALIPLAGLAAGALSTLPSIFAGALSGFAAVKLGFGGVENAIKAYDKAQTAAAISTAAGAASQRSAAQAALSAAEEERNAAESVRSAEEGLANARAAYAAEARTDAQSVAQAKEEATKRVDDAVATATADVTRYAQVEQQSADTIHSAEERVASAEQSVTDAVYSETQAQKNLVAARQDAQDQLTSYTDQLADGALEAKQLAFNVTDAQANLAKVKASPTSSAEDIAKAQLALEQAKQAVTDQGDQYDVLKRKATDAQAAGVDGAQGVLDAQHTLAQAQQGVTSAQQSQTDAQHALDEARQNAASQLSALDQKYQADLAAITSTQLAGARSVAQAESTAARNRAQAAQRVDDAQRSLSRALSDQVDTTKRLALATGSGSGGAARATDTYAAAMTKLTPQGRAFVALFTGKFLPVVDQLKSKTQAALMPGLTKALEASVPLMKDLTPFLTQAASGIGKLAASVAKFLGSKTGTAEMNAIFKAGAGFMEKMGAAAFSLLKAFGGIGTQAVPITKKLGDLILAAVNAFGKWVEGGGFQTFLTWLETNGPALLHDFTQMGLLFGNILVAITPLAVVFDNVLGFISGLINDLFRLNPVLGVAAVAFLAVTGPITAIVAGLIVLGVGIDQLVTHWSQVWGAIKGAAGDAWSSLDTHLFSPIENFFTATIPNAFSDVVGFFTGLPARIVDGVGDFVGKVFDLWILPDLWLLNHIGKPIGDFFAALPAAAAKALGAAGNVVDRIFAEVVNSFGKGDQWLHNHIGVPIDSFFAALPGDAAGAIAKAGGFIATVFSDVLSGFGKGGTWLEDHIGSPIDDFFVSMPKRIEKAASGMWDGIWEAFKGALNKVIGAWDSLNFKIPGFSVFGHHIGGFTLGLPNIPKLAAGGVVMPRAGGTLVDVAEAGAPEAILPLGDLAQLLHGVSAPTAPARVSAASGGLMTIEIGQVVANDPESFVRGLKRYVDRNGPLPFKVAVS